MPAQWEYPWYAAWDLAFHCIPFALVDSTFAKEQLVLMMLEWYLHPNGQIPAYEWVIQRREPVWDIPGRRGRVYKIEAKNAPRGWRSGLSGTSDLQTPLEFYLVGQPQGYGGKNIFQGGFLGLDNIGVFDRSAPLPVGGHLEQSDTTSWMGMYCLNMLTMAMELAQDNRAYRGCSRQQILRAFRVHLPYGEQHQRRAD